MFCRINVTEGDAHNIRKQPRTGPRKSKGLFWESKGSSDLQTDVQENSTIFVLSYILNCVCTNWQQCFSVDVNRRSKAQLAFYGMQKEGRIHTFGIYFFGVLRNAKKNLNNIFCLTFYSLKGWSRREM